MIWNLCVPTNTFNEKLPMETVNTLESQFKVKTTAASKQSMYQNQMSDNGWWNMACIQCT